MMLNVVNSVKDDPISTEGGCRYPQRDFLRIGEEVAAITLTPQYSKAYANFSYGYRTIAKLAEQSGDLENDDLMMAVRGWIESQSNWALDLDNADTLQCFGIGYASHSNNESSNLYCSIAQGLARTII